ncbi:hypothetical protein DPMN_090315 [Dreissena polymorpha]|uniref:Uncharacterized protein n=1 Tax=Dreissena polymorpha TaxID=45954 RepID=A0A9D4QY78_DREPO|nr:hypothetical protein DPMN_090315 [Dreissena polymorpha]
MYCISEVLIVDVILGCARSQPNDMAARRSQQLSSCHVTSSFFSQISKSRPCTSLKILRCIRVRAFSDTRRIVRSTVSASRRNRGTST